MRIRKNCLFRDEHKTECTKLKKRIDAKYIIWYNLFVAKSIYYGISFLLSSEKAR